MPSKWLPGTMVQPVTDSIASEVMSDLQLNAIVESQNYFKYCTCPPTLVSTCILSAN
jgi:hypothetical protein